MATTHSQSTEEMPEITEKSGSHVQHQEGIDQHNQDVDHRRQELTQAGFEIDTNELPKGYYYSPYFIGTCVGIGVNLMASTAGFAVIAPVLGQIDVALGGGPIIWVALVYTLGLAIGLTLVGRLTDLFGRRWFFISGVLLGAVGAAICGTAKTVPVLIGGQTLIGLSASTGYSYTFLVGEIVPVKYRFFANGAMFVFSLPTAGFGCAVSTAFILYTKEGWRWSYYFVIILHVFTALLYFVFYFPPNFQKKAHGQTKWEMIKDFDYVGTLLYLAGILFFILGLSWGGTVYAWKSAPVIVTVIGGFFCLVALFLYEAYRPLKEPLVPIHFFKNRGWLASMFSLSLGASVYYSQAIIWPQMTVTVYAQGRAMWAGWVGSIPGVAVTLGEIIAGILIHRTGKLKIQAIIVMTCGTICLSTMAVCNPDTQNTAIALVFLSVMFIGYNEAIMLPICTITIRDQNEIGTAAGLAGSSRSAISTVASTIYSVVLTLRLGQTLPTQVPAAVIAAGLPPSSVAGYMGAVAIGGPPAALAAVEGLTPAILAVGTQAYRVAYSDAYRTIYLTSLAFGLLGIICNIFVPNIDHLMSDSVATTLTNRKGDKGDMEEKAIVDRS